jgi:hypothetical protein
MTPNIMNEQQTVVTPGATDQIEIREATDADNEALLALTRVTPMGGRIALRIEGVRTELSPPVPGKFHLSGVGERAAKHRISSLLSK